MHAEEAVRLRQSRAHYPPISGKRNKREGARSRALMTADKDALKWPCVKKNAAGLTDSVNQSDRSELSNRGLVKLAHKARDLALFNLGTDSKLRGCDLVGLRVCHVAQGVQRPA